MEQQERIVLRIDRRWKNAIEKYLKDETLQEHLEDVLDELCNQLPEREYRKISNEIQAEAAAAHKAEEAAQTYAAYHVTENGQEWYFKTMPGEELLDTAARLHCYLRDAENGHGLLFVSGFPSGQPSSPEEFYALADLRQENTGKVTGVFEINFDSREFSALNTMDGWKSWAMQTIADAAAEAYRNPNASDDDRWRIFLDQLDGQALTTPSRLTAQNFCFEDTIEVMDDRLLHLQSVLTNTIYADELKEIYIKKDAAYKDVTEAARETMRQIVDQIEHIAEPPASIQKKLLELANELASVSGKKQYGYLKKPLKQMVDSIVDELETLPEVAAYYAAWNGLRDTLEGYYKNTPRQHHPLSQQKEFRAIKNAIIQAAEQLRQQMEQAQTAAEQEHSRDAKPSAEKTSTNTSVNPTLATENTSSDSDHRTQLPSDYLLNATVRLFHQMGQIFRDNAAPPSNPMGIRVDSKRRKKFMQKQLAMGHKQDDHEQNYSPTLQ